MVKVQVARAERACAERCTEALAALAAAEPGDKVDRAADARTAELDRYRPTIELDLAERIEREPTEIRGDRSEAC